MNPSSSGYWNNPPPPGTEFDDFEDASRDGSTRSSERTIDRIDPYVKNPAYIGRESEFSSERSRYRSRSGSRDRRRRRRSRSGDRRRRSRSRRRRRRYSASRSPDRRRRHKRHRRSCSRSTSRSRSRSRKTRRRSVEKRPKKTSSSERDRERLDGDIVKEEDMKIEEEEEEEEEDDVEEVATVPFKNDGSFLEMFKKMQEEKAAEETAAPEVKKPILPAFGKRRGGKVLKTGLVQKVRSNEEEGASSQDAWSVYMKEVRKYKEACCDDDSKTRPLVK